jgi:rhamnose transport system ATP-binding protein
MRDGSYIATHDVDKTEVAEIVKEMVGRDINALYPKEIAEIGEVILDVKNLTRIGEFSDVNLYVRSGEIVGIAGLVGAGRTEVARAIFGIDDYDTGQVTINGKKISAGDPMVTIRAGVGFVPEDRRKQGLVLDLSVTKNVTLTLRKKLARLGIISSKRERNNAAVWSKKLQVKAGSLDIPVSTLSGGNQQKIFLAKWLATEPKLLIVDEPTRGIDVGTKAEVHKLLSDLAQKGLGILMISSELPEVIGMADRIYVMKEGKVTVELLRSEVTPELVMHAATSSREESR